MATKKRSTSEIRESIESNREGLSTALTQLRGGVTELTDWRKQARKHKTELIAGTAAVGVALGLMLALAGLFRRR